MYSYMFKLQSPSKYSPFDTIHVLKHFPLLKTVFEVPRFWCFLVLLPFLFVCFTSSALAKSFPSRTFIIQGHKKVAQEEIRWIGWVGHRDYANFGQKLLNTQHGVGRCTRNHPSWIGQTHWKSSKKIHWSRRQPLTTTPASTLMHMGSENTHPAREAYITRDLPSTR